MPAGCAKRAAVLTLLLATPHPVQPFEKPPIVPGAIPAKETLQYTVEWRLITAGKARLVWSETPQPNAGWQAALHLESTGLVSKLYRVDDDYTTQLAPDLCTSNVAMTAHEGRRQRESKLTFDRESKKASYLERDMQKNTVLESKEIDIPGCVHDIIGGLFYLRTLNLESGQTVQLPVSDGKKSAMAKVEAQQKEDVKTPAGTFKTTRYEIFVFNNVLYRRNARLYIWLTDDRRKLPVQVRVRMQFTIGTITLQLAKEEKT